MSSVAFHFGAPDRLAYICRLLRKASGSGVKVMVLSDAQTLERLDAELWGVSPTDFVPHCRMPADPAVLGRSLVALTQSPMDHSASFPVLLNITDALPEGFAEFERVIEVVSQDESDRQLARQRWKQYAALGHTIVKHDIANRAAA